MFLLIAFAFLAGFVTILSPCILSIAPILLATSSDGGHQKSLGIITGLVISFSFFTLTLSAIIHATGISPDIFRYIGLGIIIFFGLTMIIPFLENAFTIFTQRIARLGTAIEANTTNIHTQLLSGLIVGIALGLVWTPCAGPILATITALAATSSITLITIFITFAYAIGAALPMLLICFGGSKIMTSTSIIAPYAQTIRKLFGMIVIATALAMIFHVDILIQKKIAFWFPTITFEQNKILAKELNMLRKSKGIEPMQQAPELIGITDWLNTSPLTLEQLKGKVILLDFWTYTCINCIRTLPHIQEWYNAYKKYDFEIIGIHTPEFAFEKSKSHVENAVKRFNITYPIALDNNYQTWQAYNNHYWPAHYLIDQNGIIIKTHFGEGDYLAMENAIRALLGISPCSKKEECAFTKALTPETYLGFERGAKNYDASLHLQHNIPTQYHQKTTLNNDQIGLRGNWTAKSDSIISNSNNNSLELNFIAQRVYLVMQSDNQITLTILLDGKPIPPKYWTKDMDAQGNIVVRAPRMYELLNLKNNYGRHTLTLQCPKGLNAYVFTFGGEYNQSKE